MNSPEVFYAWAYNKSNPSFLKEIDIIEVFFPSKKQIKLGYVVTVQLVHGFLLYFYFYFFKINFVIFLDLISKIKFKK